MLTAGETIDAALRVYVSPGTTALDDDLELRFRVGFGLRKTMAKAWTLAPHWFRHGNGTSSITASDDEGDTPSDFGSFGLHGQVYIQGQTLPPLQWIDPSQLQALRIVETAETQYPTFYTLQGRTAAGLAKIQVWQTPGSNITLDLRSYVKRVPFPIDRPPAIAAAAGASGTNLNGAYTWRMTYVTAQGETEGGTVSSSLTLTNDAATLTLPLSEMKHSVTSRKIYRTAAGGSSYLLVATVSDNTTTSYVDNIADGSLGTAAPTVTSAVTGTEQFPEDFHETLLVDGTIKTLATMQGDMRDVGFSREWQSDVRRMWAEQRQGQNQPEGFPPYGMGNQLSQGRRWRLLDA
jgi:hypothetical protein